MPGNIVRLADRRRLAKVYFSRGELNAILSIYSRRVMAGEWRDYAIDHFPDRSVFSIFRHSADRPLYSVVKQRAGNARGFEYAVVSMGKLVRRSGRLADALDPLARELKLVSG